MLHYLKSGDEVFVVLDDIDYEFICDNYRIFQFVPGNIISAKFVRNGILGQSVIAFWSNHQQIEIVTFNHQLRGNYGELFEEET